jgi:predicted AlkP superfamily phosphohydrolase/phosphomutase
VIGADSADPDLIERWGVAGELPNLMALRARGTSGRIENPPGLVSGSIWPAFHTGANPGGQPQFDALRYFDFKRYRFDNYKPDEIAEPIWRTLSRAGKRCFVMDPPYAYGEETNGVCIVDWGSHLPAKGGDVMEFAAFPKEAAEEVLRLVGPDPAGGLICDNRVPDTIEDCQHFLDAHLDRIRKKAVVAKHFLAKGGWDYFEVVFCDLHCIGHHLWHVNDRSHPRYRRALEAAVGEPLLECYRALDAAVGEILAAVGEQTVVVLYASHGIGPQYTGTGLLDRILDNLERGVQSKIGQRSFKSHLRALWRSLPPAIRAKLKPIKNRYMSGVVQDTFLSGRENRRFFEVYANNSAGGVRVNLKGREGQGKVDRADYDEVLDALANDLRQVINVESGEPLVEEIVKIRDCYAGPYLDQLPDLAVVWNKNHPIRLVSSPKIGTIRQDFEDSSRSGDHKPEGMFIAAGGGVRRTPLNHKVAPVDFLPTFCKLFDVPLENAEGTPIRPLLGERVSLASAHAKP